MTDTDTSTVDTVIALVVTYNRSTHLLKCLEALSRQTVSIAKIVVVDNASTDDTEKLMSKMAAAGDIEYLRLPKNTGGSGGFHSGMEYISKLEFDHIWIMDDDVAAENNCLEALLRHRESYDVLQPVRLYEDNSFVVSEPRSLNLSNPFGPLKQEIIASLDELDAVTKIVAVPFEGPLISRKALKATGLPEYDYFIIADDTEYSIRLLKLGFETGLVKDAILRRQIVPAKNAKNLTWKFTHHLRNHFDIDHKHGNIPVRILRPILLTAYYTATSILRRRDMNSFKMIAAAWRGK